MCVVGEINVSEGVRRDRDRWIGEIKNKIDR